MTFLDSDVIRVLEEVLPARFGGGPTDFQLVEQEDDDGHCDKNADRNFVATFHDCSRGVSTNAVSASRMHHSLAVSTSA